MKFLVLTVGGSCSPIITSITKNKPDKVVFLCSDDDDVTKNKGSYSTVIGQGLVCGSWNNLDKPNIVIQTELESEAYEVIKIKDFDNYNECYSIAFENLSKIRQKFPNADIVADYTGGTKSMTAGLVMASADVSDVIVAIVRGERNNLIKTDDGTERISLSRTNHAYVVKQIQSIEHLINHFDYASAVNILENISATSVNIPPHLNNRIDWLFGICKALDAWDKFDHKKAYQLLNRNPYKKELKELNCYLKMVIFSRSQIDTKLDLNDLIDFKATFKISGYEVVHDLIFNAERRYTQNKFDDAVARLYRALELFIQIYLKQKYDILTSDVKLEAIPISIKSKYELNLNKNNKIQIGLLDSYELSAALNSDDFVSKLFIEQKSNLLSALEKRNHSILAHGFSTVSKADYKIVVKIIVSSFLEKLLSEVEVKSIASVIQLPQNLNH